MSFGSFWTYRSPSRRSRVTFIGLRLDTRSGIDDMKTRDFVRMGIPAGACSGEAQRILQITQTAKRSTTAVLNDLHRVVDAPGEFMDDSTYGELARLLAEHAASTERFVPRDAPAPYRVWGENLEATALEQMK